jgi:threonylcarbamoyladenosine tRNA methylthiotransferase MtaB
VDVLTFGCRLNIAESELMRSHALANGLQNTVIINTCAVTMEAQRQARQAIRRTKRQRPDCRIVVTGCGVQVNPEMFSAMPEVDCLLGNGEKLKPEFLRAPLDQRQNITDIQKAEVSAGPLVTGMEGKVRAFVQAQNGCDHRCTFCIIPYGRGKSRSVPLGFLTQQIQNLVSSGVQEVVLTGVDLTAYGLDLPATPTLTQMLRRLLRHVPQLPRLRLSSLDPAEVDGDFFKLVAEEGRLMPHFHLSLQAGDDLILKRMKRRHLRHHVLAFCQKLREARPDVVLGADVIAGFPTETPENFENTLDLLAQADIFLLHVFPFSPHPGTPAARMPQVPRELVKQRAATLRQWASLRREAFYATQTGRVVTALLEKPDAGYTDHFLPLKLHQSQGRAGDIIQVRLTGAVSKDLVGERV